MNDFLSINANTDPIDALVALSRHYGADPSIVLAGGGNTSVKIGDVLHVKASGVCLATIDRDGFVQLDRNKLQQIITQDFGSDVEQREARYKEALLASRLQPQLNQRPSVESLLHNLIPARFVVHSHATVVNALTCSVAGERLARELFGDRVLWLPYVDPGYTLARTLKAALDKCSRMPQAILMANHGLIVAADDPNEIFAITKNLIDTITVKLGNDWESSFGPVSRLTDPVAAINTLAPALRGLLATEDGASLKIVTFDDSDRVLSFVGSDAARRATANGPLTPDQIVYCNSFPMWFEYVAHEKSQQTIGRLSEAIRQYKTHTGQLPRIVLVPQVGLFAVGDDYQSADNARSLYVDAIKVMAGATRLGGISHLTATQRKFIEDWEVEAYRRQIARGKASGKVAGKIAFVTGAAQGFGLEIAEQFAAEGGYVVLSDINFAGALKAAEDICRRFGKGRALGLAIDVTNGQSVAAAVHQAVRQYGGIDVLISNAGVLKAESVKTQPEKDFDFVTAVNYKGYFLCTQKVAPIMAIQHQARPTYMADIIQINSKSGLEGSNRNAAYAGSKFGGIGLTQSFALELVEDGIKVNSICPGNFFDGPLWSDPHNGLFVQYLRAGKVPGAKTIQDVRKFYESKVPMGRGCTTSDVMKAIFYLIEQQYETGQALPVTGGQVMLR